MLSITPEIEKIINNNKVIVIGWYELEDEHTESNLFTPSQWVWYEQNFISPTVEMVQEFFDKRPNKRTYGCMVFAKEN